MKISRIRTQDPIIELGSKTGFTTEPGNGLELIDSIELDGDVVLLGKAGKPVVAYPWGKTSGAVVVRDDKKAAGKKVG